VRFVLTGFTEDAGCRVFTFERIAEDQARTKFVVKADLALSRRHDIRLQELPLLCREILERCDADEQARTFIYTEADMIVHAEGCASDQAARQRKMPTHKAQDKANGVAWRTPRV